MSSDAVAVDHLGVTLRHVRKDIEPKIFDTKCHIAEEQGA